MTIRRLRPLPEPAALRAMYPVPHDHRRFGRGHAERVEATIALAKATLGPWFRDDVADLSCGNAVIARALVSEDGRVHLGDLAGAPTLAIQDEWGYTGPIEESLQLLPHVDLFVCSETIEHLHDPHSVLVEVRSRADRLLLSTPLECWDDENPEHLWAWDREGVEWALGIADWQVVAFDQVDTREYGEPYCYGIWVCR